MLGRAMAMARPKLYVQPGSHPCAAVEAALALKSIAYDRVDLLPLSALAIGPLRWGGTTVPGMRLGGERLVGSRTIIHRLEALVAEPALLPAAGSPYYARVLEAERWGDEVLQAVPRRVINIALVRRPAAMESYAADSKLPLPIAPLRPALPLVARLLKLRSGTTDAAARADLAALPSQLARIDGWIAEGLLGSDRPNAADLQIGSSMRLLMSMLDLRPLIAAHPASALTRYFPPMAGEVPEGALPAAWLPSAAPA